MKLTGASEKWREKTQAIVISEISEKKPQTNGQTDKNKAQNHYAFFFSNKFVPENLDMNDDTYSLLTAQSYCPVILHP